MVERVRESGGGRKAVVGNRGEGEVFIVFSGRCADMRDDRRVREGGGGIAR